MDSVRGAMALVLASLLPATTVQSEPGLWLQKQTPTTQAAHMLDVLERAQEYGLPPSLYSLDMAPAELEDLFAGRASAELRERFDGELTRSVTLFLTHVHAGRVSARAADFHLSPPRPIPEDAVRRIARGRNVDAVIASFEPRSWPYRSLKHALTEYRELARQPDLTSLPPLPARSIGVGDEYAGASTLRTLLRAFGDLEVSIEEPGQETYFDAALGAALRRFQDRHGLEVDGLLGRRTLQALMTPLARRVRQIELALERWRWMSGVGRPDIVVNVPQYTLHALPQPNDPAGQAIEMSVIVGLPERSTPVFVAVIREVVFNPYWDVPTSIMREELLPLIRRNPSYLKRHHFEIVRGATDDAEVMPPTQETLASLTAGRFRLRQRPGADNALGPVKFVLLNPYGVRLHGTPAVELFTHQERALSHGCIRVSQPAVLALYVLEKAKVGWDAEAVEAAIYSGRTLRVTLSTPVRVAVMYATAAPTRSRGLLFAEDIYGHDALLEQLLQQAAQRS